MVRWKVSTKLMIAFGSVLLLTVVAGLAGLRLADSADRHTHEMFEADVTGLVQLSDITLRVNQVRRAALVHVLETDRSDQAILEADVKNLSAAAEAGFESLRRTWSDDPRRLELLEDVREEWTRYEAVRDRTLALSRGGRFAEARAFATGAAATTFPSVSDGLGNLVRASETSAERRLSATEESFVRGQRVVISVVIAAVLLGLITASLLSRRIARNLGEVERAAEEFAAGDLNRRAEVRSDDEVEVMARAFNAMADRLAATVSSERDTKEALQAAVRDYTRFSSRVAEGDLTARLTPNGNGELAALAEGLNGMVTQLGRLSAQIRDGAQSIGSTSSQILATASQHTASASEQSAAINQTSTTVDEIRVSGKQVATRANEVADQASLSARVSDEGTRSVEAIVEGMREIRRYAEAVSTDILELSDRTRQIGEITATADELADRSNLLALNATIEAARAGEQGKGFAVVADEVRSLAQQSKQAAGQVRTILGDIQKATDAAVLASEQGSRVVESGMELAERAGETIGHLTATIHGAAQSVQQITASTQEQSVGMDQIAHAMADISEATNQFVSGVESSQAAAEDLHRLAQELQSLTESYRI